MLANIKSFISFLAINSSAVLLGNIKSAITGVLLASIKRANTLFACSIEKHSIKDSDKKDYYQLCRRMISKRLPPRCKSCSKIIFRYVKMKATRGECRHAERFSDKLSVKQPGSGADMLKDLQKNCLLSRLAVVQTY